MSDEQIKKHLVPLNERAIAIEFRVIWNHPEKPDCSDFEFPRCEITVVSIVKEMEGTLRKTHRTETEPHELYENMMLEILSRVIHEPLRTLVNRGIFDQFYELTERNQEYILALEEYKKHEHKGTEGDASSSTGGHTDSPASDGKEKGKLLRGRFRKR